MAKMERRCKRDNNTRKSRVSCKESLPEPDNCIICFEKVSCRGKLGICEHWFCFQCIHEWSKNTNTCPVCKKKFRCISKTHLSHGKSPVQKIRVSDIDQRVWNDDDPISADMLSSSEDSFESDETDIQDLTFIVPDSDSEVSVPYVVADISSSDDYGWNLPSSSASSSSHDDWPFSGSSPNKIHDKKETNADKRRTNAIHVGDNSSDDSDNDQAHVMQISTTSTTIAFKRKTNNTRKVSTQHFKAVVTRAASSRQKDCDGATAPAEAASSSTRRNRQSATTSTSGLAVTWLNVARDRASRATERQKPKEKPKERPGRTRNEKPTAHRVTNTHRSSRGQSNEVTAPTNTVQRNQRSQNVQPKTRRKTRVNAFIMSDSENSDQERKTTTDSDDPPVVPSRTVRRFAVLSSPEALSTRKSKRRHVLRERQNNNFE